MTNEIALNAGRPERLFDDRDLSRIPGRYFRSVQALPARQESSLSDHQWFDRGDHTQAKREVTYLARRAVPEGVTLLAVRLHFLDDILHSVEMAAHPADTDRSNLIFMAEEFFTAFVEEPEGDRVREEEIDEVRRKIAETQQRLASSADQIALLAPATKNKPTAGELVKAVDRKDDLAGRAHALAVQAEERMQLIKAGTKEIEAQTALLANFYQEKATAALALVDDQIKFAKDVAEGLQTLSLYTGEGVNVETVAEGAPADPSEPLTLYQDRLYFDEELAVELLTGGFDFSSLSKLGEFLAADAGLLDRMIPAKRGAVLLQVRRESKRYFDDPAMALADALLNDLNYKVYLLVRNGENVHLVNSEITTDAADRLFPTAKEIDDAFKTWGREVRPEHLDYSKARSEFERKTVFYRRMLLMLWGLNDRLNLFGDFYDRSKFDNWYDPEFQAARMVYVHDGEGTLGVRRPSFHEWMTLKNRGLQAGSRVAVQWRKAVNAAAAPALYSSKPNRNGECPRIYQPANEFEIVTVERRADRLVARCEAVGEMRTDWTKTRRFEARVDLSAALYDEPTSLLCIDRVTVEELDYYLNSRKERRNYQAYLYLFRELRAVLAAEEEVQKPHLASIEADLVEHARLTAERARDVTAEAVSLWRAQHSSRLIGGDGWKAQDHNTVLDVAFALGGARSDLVELARQDIPRCVPIEVRIDGRGAYWLYREVRDDELEEFEKKLPRALVNRVQLRIGKKGLSEVGKPQRAYLANPEFRASHVYGGRTAFVPNREVTVSRDDEKADEWSARSLPAWTPFEEIRQAASAASHDASTCLAALNSEDLADEVLAILMANRTGNVARTSFTVPVAFLSFDSKGSNNGFHVLCLTGNGLDILGKLDEARANLIIDRFYLEAELRKERLRDALAGLPDDALPLKLACRTATNAGALAAEGREMVNASTANDRELYVKRGFGNSPAVAASIEDLLYREFESHSQDKRDGLNLVWMNETNRNLAERYFSVLANK